MMRARFLSETAGPAAGREGHVDLRIGDDHANLIDVATMGKSCWRRCCAWAAG